MTYMKMIINTFNIRKLGLSPNLSSTKNTFRLRCKCLRSFPLCTYTDFLKKLYFPVSEIKYLKTTPKNIKNSTNFIMAGGAIS
ncbi:hypothetical protein CIL05_10680 [Virgibacillus profundi]|uniref:Uncharacterized protein n=1 Tax=Virgibacillus profundi TaxID=2024555 RepID=A0A2A2IF92_9BACI|nr:hypothetical protein CIL05_10680 [Virgibacillus profundi]PXY53991.1 hypothetical protein CIT14_10780 [Virgibacillus profundi]